MIHLGSKFHAHHVLPQAKVFTQFFSRAGITNIHDPIYGAWVKTSLHVQQSAAYHQAWLKFMQRNPQATMAEILTFAQNAMATIMQQPTLFQVP